MRTALKHLSSPLGTGSHEKVLVLNQSSTANIAIQETNELDEKTILPQITGRIQSETPAVKDTIQENFAFQTQAN